MYLCQVRQVLSIQQRKYILNVAVSNIYVYIYIYIIPYTAKAFSLGCNILKPKQAVETNIDMTPIVMLLKYIMEYADCSTVGAIRKCTTGSSTHE